MYWPGPSRFQISTLAISCSCSNWYTSKYPHISPCWRVCLPTAWAALTSSTAFIFGVIPEDRSGGHSQGFLNKRQTPLCFLLGEGKQRSSSGRDPTLCCWDNGKCGRARKHEEMHGCAFQTHARNVCFNPQTWWCWSYKGRYWWEFFVCVSLFNQELKLCFCCFHSDEQETRPCIPH